MGQLNNPFVVYGYKGPEYFCDRVSETEKIMSALANERNVTLVAPRRMGKTGLIHHVFRRIAESEPETRCFYIDIFATKNLHQMVQLFAQTILGSLDSHAQNLVRRLQTFFGSWRPSVSFDPVTGAPSVTLDIKPSESVESLKGIFEYMRQSGKRCYVAVDEFQQILSYPEEGVEALLRSYVQFLPNVYFIFSGSEQHLISEMFLSAKRPFYQSTQIISLGSIDQANYLAFANAFFAQQSREMTEEVFAHIYHEMRGITWYIQTMLSRFYESRDLPLTLESAELCLADILSEQEAVYQNYCSWLTANQQMLLVAIAKEKQVEKPLANDFLRSHNLTSPSSVRTALSSLLDRQLLTFSNGVYYVTDIFFSLWLKAKF